MAKAQGMHSNRDRKLNGRSGATIVSGPRPTRPNTPQEARVDANRPVSAGAGKHRGDRRDMSKHYTGTDKHAARGNTPRKDVSTRAR